MQAPFYISLIIVAFLLYRIISRRGYFFMLSAVSADDGGSCRSIRVRNDLIVKMLVFLTVIKDNIYFYQNILIIIICNKRIEVGLFILLLCVAFTLPTMLLITNRGSMHVHVKKSDLTYYYFQFRILDFYKDSYLYLYIDL